MKKLKAWQIVLLILFYPIGICYLIYWVVKKKSLKNDSFKSAEYAANISFQSTPEKTYKIAGVTFNNNDGSSRQTILSKVKAGDRLNFVATEHDGSPAIAIFTTQNQQIGFVKSGSVSMMLKLMEEGSHPVVAVCDKFIDEENKTCYYAKYKMVK